MASRLGYRAYLATPPDLRREYAVVFMKAKHDASEKEARAAWLLVADKHPMNWGELEMLSVRALKVVKGTAER
ncbi:hypothetical protein SEA_WHEELBITE_81 [Arthrobacter phage Wheelbite]|uniref:Uncharacterized protein n=1 Tax=Arthrobacter phage Wheelbite TaxID=2015873 RepID=A0A222ZIJ7_9CAUD|nr:HTH DNA binding protein [Arthrobacter phage Wheelbite]ASR84169.1 hypothetical protein SEA_WHEELBITE_81 [Arthrobacter phage Wheelbite]